MTRLLLKTSSSHEDWYGGCECALLEITPELLAALRAKCEIAAEAFAKDDSLSELYFWGAPAEFYDYDVVSAACEAGIESEFEDEGRVFLPDSFNMAAFEPQAVECGQTIIRCDAATNGQLTFGVVFFCYPKHDSIAITTYETTIEEMEKALAASPSQPCVSDSPILREAEGLA